MTIYFLIINKYELRYEKDGMIIDNPLILEYEEIKEFPTEKVDFYFIRQNKKCHWVVCRMSNPNVCFSERDLREKVQYWKSYYNEVPEEIEEPVKVDPFCAIEEKIKDFLTTEEYNIFVERISNSINKNDYDYRY
jgi:hypothetical protein